jgi:hypothetical protein
MPGGEDQYDRFHTLDPQFSGKTKTSRLSPRKVGDDKAPEYLRVPVVDSTDSLEPDEGTLAYVTGTGTQTAGLYVADGSTFGPV